MKRLLIMVTTMVMVLAIGAAATAEAQQSGRSERTVQGSYGPYPGPVAGCNLNGRYACLVVDTRSTEKFLTAKVTDAHGQPVWVEVEDGYGRVANFCGSTSRAIPIRPGNTLFFYIGWDIWSDSLLCPAHRIHTTGTIRVTLSDQP